MTERKGDWILTYSGRKFYPLDPRIEDICIIDIAHVLARICRFGGHTKYDYYVGQHSVHVSEHLPDEYKLWGLLHDASEAYIMDIVKPLKPYLTNYKEIEGGIMKLVAEKYDLCPIEPKEVKEIDNAILCDEMRSLMPWHEDTDWMWKQPGLGINITPWSSQYTKERFLHEFDKLTANKGPTFKHYWV